MKIGQLFYNITSKDLLYHKESVSITTLDSSTEKFSDNLRPNKEFLYHIIRIAIDGYLEFQLQFPDGVPHWSPHGITERLDWRSAGFPLGIKTSIFVQNPYYPSFNTYNPKGYTVTGDFYFWGWKYTIKDLKTIPATFFAVTDYGAGGGGG